MTKPKKSPAARNLVVAPPRPTALEPGAEALVAQKPKAKRAVTGRGKTLARDTRGKADRAELRRVEKRIDAPRHTGKPAERSGVQRSHKAKARPAAPKAPRVARARR